MYVEITKSPWKLKHTNILAVDWVDLAIIDLSQFEVPGGKKKLATQLYDALKNIGEYHLTKL